MNRKELPRIYELRDLAQHPNPNSPDAYFRDFDETLAAWPQKRKQFCDLEEELQSLDDEAWICLKAKTAPLLIKKDTRRGWQPLFDKLNEAKAYKYLKRVGYRNIQFICECSVRGQQIPDLEADDVLCEVKTINISEIEACRRQNCGVGTITDQLGDGFFSKLASDLEKAKQQLEAYWPEVETKKIVYVVVNFDDALHEYADRYQCQIDKYIASNPMPEVEVVFDIKPPFYAAAS